MVANPDRVGHHRKDRVDRADAREDARVGEVEVARQEVAALQEQELLSSWGECVGERSAPGAAAHDDDIVPIRHVLNMLGVPGITHPPARVVPQS